MYGRKLLICVLLAGVSFLFINATVVTEVFPDGTRTLASFGAKGDGSTDDTQALNNAFLASAKFCLDGENKTYVVIGTLQVNHNFCLQNARFIQKMTPIDTTPYILSYKRPLPVIGPFDPPITYPEDPVLTDLQHAQLVARNDLRTLVISGNSLDTTVVLKNIYINKGLYEEMGSSAAAAIHIGRAYNVTISNLEVTGKGQGKGLSIGNNVGSIQLDQIKIHDIDWALAKGNPPHTIAEMRDQWKWNNVPIYVYDKDLRKFAIVRSQEKASGLVITGAKDVTISNSVISKIRFKVDGISIPWQADGMTLGAINGLKIQDTLVEQGQEGIDLSGKDEPGMGVSNFRIERVTLKNNFNYGLKIVHSASNGYIRDLIVRNSGKHGVVVAGPVKNMLFSKLDVGEIGSLILDNNYTFRPGFNMDHAGFGVMSYNIADRSQNPEHIRVVDSTFVSTTELPEYGIMGDNLSYLTHVVEGSNKISGFKKSASKVHVLNYGYADVRRSFGLLLGCDGTLEQRVWAWDQASGSVRSPVWQLEDMQNWIRSQGKCN